MEISAIIDCLPPKTDYLTYLTILESHLSPEILPELNKILQDPELTQNIGWDLVHNLLQFSGAEPCLTTIARLGNPREVILKVTEALQLLRLNAEDNESNHSEDNGPTVSEKFCILIRLLSILHPRIKTKYPSRFLSTSLKSILASYQPTTPATLALIAFLHAVSGEKRPSLPERTSDPPTPIKDHSSGSSSAPDPEAQDEEPEEAAIQIKLLQSFITHILEEYINKNPLEWAARLHEFTHPNKLVASRSQSEAFRNEVELQLRDNVVGQLVALSRDLQLSGYGTLFDACYDKTLHASESDSADNYPCSPADIPLAKVGALFLITSYIFSSVVFQSKLPQPELDIFPGHAKLLKNFIGVDGASGTGEEEISVIDAILAIGLWLESNNRFVAEPLKDIDFFEQLQSLSLLSAHTPSSSLRYAAHSLCSSILHAHPTDRVRLIFISDTLENCPYEALKASAVSWLKEEISNATDRNSENLFSSRVAMAATQPYLFLDMSSLVEAEGSELLHEIMQSIVFHMAVLNFLIFLCGQKYSQVVPVGMLTTAKEIYLKPLQACQERALVLAPEIEGDDILIDLQLLENRIRTCACHIEKSEAQKEDQR
ncbi:unnamed protein product [Blumeria hordei]|uniref:DUF1760-domain-containing protein n=1 Tax=Blumeria hordei TaxID=2867405 RepID=A0A383UJ48_BLUHO|nr:unnamed protein product [Blumeria hordei]